MAALSAVYHTRTFPLQVNQCRLDPAVCGSLLALPVTKTTVGVWDLTDPKSEAVSLVGHKRAVSALNFSHDEPRLLCSAGDDYVIVWNVRKCLQNAAQGVEVRGEVILSRPGDVTHACFSVDAARVALCVDAVVKIVNISLSKVVAELAGHTAKVTAAEFCPHFSATLVTISDDRTVVVWDVQNFSLVYQSTIISSAPLISLCMNRQEVHVAVASAGGMIKVFNLEDDKNFRQLSQIDVGKILSKSRQNQQQRKNSGSEGGPVVVTKGGVARKSEAPAVGGGDSNFSSIESSDVVLSLMYAYSSSGHTSISPERAHFGPNTQGHGAVGQVLTAQSPILIIISSHCMIQVDSKTLQVLSVVDFQESIPSWFQSSVPEMTISAIGLAALGQVSQTQLAIVVGTQFESRVHSIQWELASAKSCEKETGLESPVTRLNLTFSPRAASEICSPQESSEELSIVAFNPLVENSPLKSELVLQSTSSATTANGRTPTSRRGSVGMGAKKPDPMNQPLTFKAKVKSSGYTQAPHSHTNMFKPHTNFRSKSIDASKTRKGQSLVSKIASQEYPHDAGPPSERDCNLSTGAIPAAVTGLKFSGTGQSLACSMSNKTCLVFPAPFAHKDSNVLVGHDSSVNTVSWSKSGKYLLTASNDKSAILWDRATSEMVVTFDRINNNFHDSGSGDKSKNRDNYTKEVKGAQFFYMDKFVLVVTGNQLCMYKYHLHPAKPEIKRYLTKSKYKLVKSWETSSQNFTSLAAANAFYSHLAVCAGSNRDLEIYDLNEGRLAHVFNDAHTKPANAIALNEGSTYTSQPQEALNVFATSATLDCIKMWDVRSRRCVLRLQGHSNQAHGCGIAFSACGTYLASGSEDKLAYVYDVRQGTFCQKLRGHTDVVASVAFHPARPVLATGAIKGKVLLFKA
ncbi:WD repeat-containing protein 27-like [Littorina saxatilis]|uniref:WD repeat-containing protein 27 n=1 Tax=Littorina saxatilis TaxID=31220 RepID=A0AAN9GFH5_9CAEN